jgi:predicted histone-like DNA-binding protein
MNIQVIAFYVKHFYNGTLAKLLYLKQKAKSSRLWTLEKLAAEIEETSSLSKGDVVHVTSILTTEMRKVLINGDRVKIPGLGIFFMTLSCKGVETKEELNVRNIEKVNIRFRPDKSLKLVNAALAPTRSVNNVSFSIEGIEDGTETTPVEEETPSEPGGGIYIDPNA